MADERALELPEQAIAELAARQKDFESIVLARLGRSPVGTIEWTLSTIPRQHTIFLHGQTLSRADYPDLWSWAQATAAAGFGTGNGTTTFTVPDTRGRVLRCTPASGETVGQQTGSDTRTLTTSNLPAHDHNVSISAAGSHSHSGVVDNSGVHGGHNSGAVGDIGGPGPWSIASSTQNNNGGHTHSFDTDSAGSHSHSVSEDSVGSSTPVDIRQAALNGHCLIWC